MLVVSSHLLAATDNFLTRNSGGPSIRLANFTGENKLGTNYLTALVTARWLHQTFHPASFSHPTGYWNLSIYIYISKMGHCSSAMWKLVKSNTRIPTKSSCDVQSPKIDYFEDAWRG